MSRITDEQTKAIDAYFCCPERFIYGITREEAEDLFSALNAQRDKAKPDDAVEMAWIAKQFDRMYDMLGYKKPS